MREPSRCSAGTCNVSCPPILSAVGHSGPGFWRPVFPATFGLRSRARPLAAMAAADAGEQAEQSSRCAQLDSETTRNAGICKASCPFSLQVEACQYAEEQRVVSPATWKQFRRVRHGCQAVKGRIDAADCSCHDAHTMACFAVLLQARNMRRTEKYHQKNEEGSEMRLVRPMCQVLHSNRHGLHTASVHTTPLAY